MSREDRTDATPRLLKIREALAQLNISETTLYELVHAGKLELRKIGTGSRVTQESVDRLVESLPIATLRRKARVASRRSPQHR